MTFLAATIREEIPPGTLYMLILKTLARNEAASPAGMHGFEIARFIQNTTGDVLQVEEGSLYPALQRMLLKGWVIAAWGQTADKRRARYYSLTSEGRKQLDEELARYSRVGLAIARVLEIF
jgi:PadR family transcriptional regulator, regulatory protein PadR